MEPATHAAIEVVSDVVCPWCYIGKRRLEKALTLLGRPNATVRWTPFELNPGAPREGMSRQEYRARKFGSLEHSRQLDARVVAAGSDEGIGFRFDRIAVTPNTFDAHRLIWLADSAGRQDETVENLFRAYFIDGANVGDPGVLKSIAAQSGLQTGDVEELFSGDLGGAEVRAAEHRARTLCVSGVPTFAIDGELIASGAQTPELLASMLGPALEQRQMIE